MIRHLCGVGAALCAALATTTAHAEGYPIDIEFVRPSFGHASFSGVEVPATRGALAVRYGTVLQYQLDPLTLYDSVDESEIGAVVTNRGSAQFGVSMDLSERVSVGILVPAAVNWGTEQPAFAADGAGIGDVGAGVRFVAVRAARDRLQLGLRSGLILPTGRPDAYLGEGTMRASGGLLASLAVGPVTVATDAGVLWRTTFETPEDFSAGDEFVWGNAARVALPAATRTAFTGQLLSRSGLEHLWDGGAENAAELLGGVEFMPSRKVTLSAGAGRGLTKGYGTTDVRLLGGLMVELSRPDVPVEIEPQPRHADPDPDPHDDVLPDHRPVPDVGEVLIFEEQILIGDRIEFVVGTNILQPYSHPTLDTVAALVNDTAAIGHVVIEGHASEEGSFEYNYRLAASRAERIWEELLGRGVARSRVSHTGIGEVAPLVTGNDETSLQENRRVEFHIKRQFTDAEDVPDYPDTQLLPWSGRRVPVVQPTWRPIAPAPDPEVDPLDFDDGEDFEFDDALR